LQNGHPVTIADTYEVAFADWKNHATQPVDPDQVVEEIWNVDYLELLSQQEHP